MRRLRKRRLWGRCPGSVGGERAFNRDGKRSLRVWILILGRREGQGCAKGPCLASEKTNAELLGPRRSLSLTCLPNTIYNSQRCTSRLTATYESMWGLDRISGYSTPSGTPPPRLDSYSPAPRRGYPTLGPGPLPHRPGINPRSSSLSLISPNSSSTSLGNPSRAPNGALRRRPTGGPYHNGPDPLQVLESIMGGPSRRPKTTNGDTSGGVQKPKEVVEDIDFGGLSLQDFAAEEPVVRRQPTSVHTYSAQSVEECMCLCLNSRLYAHFHCR